MKLSMFTYTPLYPPSRGEEEEYLPSRRGGEKCPSSRGEVGGYLLFHHSKMG
jgi:hypothetical protein